MKESIILLSVYFNGAINQVIHRHAINTDISYSIQVISI